MTLKFLYLDFFNIARILALSVQSFKTEAHLFL